MRQTKPDKIQDWTENIILWSVKIPFGQCIGIGNSTPQGFRLD